MSSRQPRTSPHEPAAEGWRGRLTLPLILALSLGLNLYPVTWGLPSIHGWAFDEILPQQVLAALKAGFAGGWAERYPPVHFALLALLFVPLRPLVEAGILGGGAWDLIPVLLLAARLLSVAMATATVYLVYRAGRQLPRLGRSGARLAALTAALVCPFAYYGKTANLEVPYLFWFSLSLVFYLAIWRRQRLRDYVAFAAAGTLAICTKDQAFGLYLAAPLLLWGALWHHRRAHGEAGLAPWRVLADRRLVAAAATTVAVFVLAQNLLLNPSGFVRHIHLMRAISGPAAEYPATLAGHLLMAQAAGRHVTFTLGVPLLVAALAGIAVALARPRRHAALASLLAFPVAYYLGFIVPIRYHYVRFFLPVALLLALFVATALVELAPRPGWRRRAWWAAAAASLLVALLRTLSVGAWMDADSRYLVGPWLEGRLAPGESALAVGRSRVVPRGLRRIDWPVLFQGGSEPLRAADPRFVVISRSDLFGEGVGEVMRRFERGDLNYRPVARLRGRPWLDRLSIDGVRTNLEKINPELLVLERVRPWGPPRAAVRARIAALAREGGPDPRAAVASTLRRQAVDGLQPLVGDLLMGFDLRPDGWLRSGARGAVVAVNPGDRPFVPLLHLTCRGEQARLLVEVDDGESVRRWACNGGQKRRFSLAAVPAGGERLVLITARARPGAAAGRPQGLTVEPREERRPLGPGVAAVGLTRDGWTDEEHPAAVVVTNPGGTARHPRLWLACWAPPEALPITVRWAWEGGQSRHVFTAPGVAGIDLPVAPAFSETAVLLWTEGAWTPGEGDERRLGVKLLGAG